MERDLRCAAIWYAEDDVPVYCCAKRRGLWTAGRGDFPSSCIVNLTADHLHFESCHKFTQSRVMSPPPSLYLSNCCTDLNQQLLRSTWRLRRVFFVQQARGKRTYLNPLSTNWLSTSFSHVTSSTRAEMVTRVPVVSFQKWVLTSGGFPSRVSPILANHKLKNHAFFTLCGSCPQPTPTYNRRKTIRPLLPFSCYDLLGVLGRADNKRAPRLPQSLALITHHSFCASD